MIIIATHSGSDFDAIASLVAAKKLYPNAEIANPGNMEQNVRKFLSIHSDLIYMLEPSLIDPSAVERVIMVDCNRPERLNLPEALIQKIDDAIKRDNNGFLYIFDHHPVPVEIGSSKYFEFEECGATVTILVELIRESGIDLDQFEATLLSLGVHEDTGSLTFMSTTPRDAKALAWLMERGARIDVIEEFIRTELSEDRKELLSVLEENAVIKDYSGVKVAIAWAACEDYIEGLSYLGNHIMASTDSDAAFLIVENKQSLQIAGSSRGHFIDVNEVLKELGGGGHKNIATAILRGEQISTVRKRLEITIEENVLYPLLARDIMNSKFKTVKETAGITEASREMSLLGLNEMLVENDEERVVGIISRRDTDRAAHHNLSHAPVKGFMSKNVIKVSSELPIHDIRRIMISKNIGHVLIDSEKGEGGFISRGDVLRALYGSQYANSGFGAHILPYSDKGEIISRIRETLPPKYWEFLRQASAVSDEMESECYLVGGVVRDIILCQRNLDIDLVVEGDGIAFAERLAQDLGAVTRSHRKFGTSVIMLAGGGYVDVASARAEFYEQPAALPTVMPSSIAQDLYRRDFTINTMAIALSEERFGELIDFYGGMSDLRKGIIRALHNLSFVEDPTRIFRAVRFEGRFGFRMEPQTEENAKRALDMDLIERMSPVRVRDELIPILSEETAFGALKRLKQLKALECIEKDIPVERELFRKISLINENTEAYKEIYNASEHATHTSFGKEEYEIRQWVLRLTALCSEMKTDSMERFLNTLLFRRNIRRIILLSLRDTQSVIDSLKLSDAKNSVIIDALEGKSPENMAYLFAVSDSSEARSNIERFLKELFYIKPDVGRDDLRAMGIKPSKEAGAALRELRKELADGAVLSRQEQMEIIKELLSRRSLEKGFDGVNKWEM